MDEGYRRRVVDDEIDAVFPHLAAFSLQGARGVGKTETALQRAASVWRLDDPFRAQVASADPESVLADAVPVLIDEWQRLPAIWDFVRRSVDARAPGGSFLLTGSMVPLEHPVHSGAGRIPAIRMRPMSLMERLQAPPTVSVSRLMDGGRPPLRGSTPLTLSDYAHEIVRTGFPGLRDLPDRTRRLQLEAYIESLMERDFEQLGHRVRAPATLLRWLTAYASATSTTASFEAIRRAASPGEANPPPPPRSTVVPYMEVLGRLFLIDPVPGWSPVGRPLRRAAAAGKHHLADPGIAAFLLGVEEERLLREPSPDGPSAGRPLLAALFESLVALSVRVYARTAEARVGHLRTRAGEHEVDLIVHRGSRVIAIEVKMARVVTDGDARHLRWLAHELGDDLVDSLIVTAGPEAYRLPDGVGVVPAALLGP